MNKILLIGLLFFYLSINTCSAAGSEMVITISEDYSVQVHIDSGEPLSAEAGVMVGSGEVQAIYREKVEKSSGPWRASP